MLVPDYLESTPDELVQLMQKLEDDILRDIGRRIGKMEMLTNTAQWQLWRLDQIQGLREDIVKLLARYSGKSDDAIRRILQESGTVTLAVDDPVYHKIGLYPSGVECAEH